MAIPPLKASFFHSLPNQTWPVPISMLKRLLLSPSSIHQKHHYLLQLSPVSKNFQFNSKRSSSRPLSIISSRPFRSHRVLAMAEREDKMASHSHKYTNRLAAEHSPYLLQHAHNPVDWYPWGEEAFAEARRRDVPIFLSSIYDLSTVLWQSELPSL